MTKNKATVPCSKRTLSSQKRNYESDFPPPRPPKDIKLIRIQRSIEWGQFQGQKSIREDRHGEKEWRHAEETTTYQVRQKAQYESDTPPIRPSKGINLIPIGVSSIDASCSDRKAIGTIEMVRKEGNGLETKLTNMTKNAATKSISHFHARPLAPRRSSFHASSNDAVDRRKQEWDDDEKSNWKSVKNDQKLTMAPSECLRNTIIKKILLQNTLSTSNNRWGTTTISQMGGRNDIRQSNAGWPRSMNELAKMAGFFCFFSTALQQLCAKSTPTIA